MIITTTLVAELTLSYGIDSYFRTVFKFNGSGSKFIILFNQISFEDTFYGRNKNKGQIAICAQSAEKEQFWQVLPRNEQVISFAFLKSWHLTFWHPATPKF